MFSVQLLWLTLLLGAQADPAPINPTPQAVLRSVVRQWKFDDGVDGWVAERGCEINAVDGLLKIQANDDDPYMHTRIDTPGGRMTLRMRARGSNEETAAIYWVTRESPRRGADKAKEFPSIYDGQWQEQTVTFNAPGHLVDLRIDPGATAGDYEIDWIELIREQEHPLAVERLELGETEARFVVRNSGPTGLSFSLDGQSHDIAPHATVTLRRPIATAAPLEKVGVQLHTEEFPPVDRTVFLFHAEAACDWISRPLGAYSLDVAPDATVARLRRGEELVGTIAPLVHCEGVVPSLRLVQSEPSLRFEGDGVSLEIGTSDNQVSIAIVADRPCEGPVVRALGELEQGLFAGLEYLGKGERSSTKLDIETPEHLRFAPDPLKVTMPLMAFVTDRASLAMTWSEMSLQPVFATPNFFDVADDHRMTLRGQRIEAVIRVDESRLEDCILWAVRKKGLPPLPQQPRSRQQQWDLCANAMQGPLKTDDGWGHCVEQRWERKPFADMASTVWRLTGQIPDLPDLTPSGAHIRNDAIYFLTGRANEWLGVRRAQADNARKQQQPDGSFRYVGRMARGHFEDTASGLSAKPAARLLEYARLTGDQEALAAGVKTLEYMKRFRTPRGAQVWEIPLHTPDQLASAYLVRAYVRGYELTGKEEYLELARKWALSGVPFVYLWGSEPVMVYSTPPVYGATNWQAPSWFGLPVQWVGLVYAYSLGLLAPYDDSLDWNHLAWGILIAGEQMQYPDGDYAGLLPDAFALKSQQRRPWTINPCALVSLRLLLEGKVDSLSVAADEEHRVASPFRVRLVDGKAHIQGSPGVIYQVLLDGQRVIDVRSEGDDVISLE